MFEIDDNYLDLSEEYLGLKNKIISSTVYGNEDRVKDLEALFDEIYNRFYNNLPEEEQLLC